MMNLASANVTSTAAPPAFFATWADMATWPEWNGDTEWVRLDGPFTKGSTGVLKPKGGPRTRFVIANLTDSEFTDVSLLVGARLTFQHLVGRTSEGLTQISVTCTLTGPLARVWNLILGKGIKATIQEDLDNLARAAEAVSGNAALS
jgi:hypothetical protein